MTTNLLNLILFEVAHLTSQHFISGYRLHYSSATIHELHCWMRSNRLNPQKTQVIWLGLRRQLDISISGILLMSTTVPLFSTVLRVDMDVITDGSLTMSSHVSTVYQSAFYKLRHHLWTISEFVCVSCQLDYCNGLVYGVADSQLRRLSLLQNT